MGQMLFPTRRAPSIIKADLTLTYAILADGRIKVSMSYIPTPNTQHPIPNTQPSPSSA